ncbi:MAG: imidazolonepropionase, partial [Stenotrophomonas sp.]
MRCDTLWHNANLMTLDDASGGLGSIRDGVIAARDGRILHVGPAADA